MNARVAAVLAEVRGNRVLNVGCAGHARPDTPERRARWLHGALVARGYSVLGLDVDERQLEWMRDEGHEVLALDAQRLDELDESFDTIVAGELIEHLENPGLFLEACQRRLTDAGRLVLTTPNAFGPLYWLTYASSGGRAANPEHTCWFDGQTLGQLLRRAGYRVERTQHVDDLRTDAASSAGYRAFAAAWGAARQVLPARFRHTLVVTAALERSLEDR
jgi:2-polyprenyl-3-methyl-5-hydroxy-6-metoxy-1,4-benzoquinol methylase